jgi:hypothetical protein
LSIFKKIIKCFGLKPIALKIYFCFFNSYNFSQRKIEKKITQLRVNAQVKKGYLNLTIESDWLGFGARIIKVLELLKYSNEVNVEFNIKFAYKGIKEDDFFQRLFELNTKKIFQNKRYINIKDSNDIVHNRDLNKGLTIIEANNIFFKEYKIKKHVLVNVNQFEMNNFKHNRILGVHFRGTDKVGEAPRVTNSNLLKAIQTLLDQQHFDKVFISSDESVVIDFIKSNIKNVNVICREDKLRSNNGEQFHRKIENSMELVNFEALCNILILSKTDFLLKSSSIMSDCCFILNPKLEYQILNEPHSKDLTWWPATELLNAQSNKYC